MAKCSNIKTRRQAFTAQDAETARMIGVLLMVSKMLDSAKQIVRDQDEMAAAEKAAKIYEAFIKNAHNMFPGGDMERRVLDFAKNLGFEVEQQYLTQGSDRTQ